MRTTMLFFVILTMIGCDGGGGTGDDSGTGGGEGASCDLRTAQMYCQEFTSFDEAAFPAYEDACVDGDGTWAMELCPRASAIGGCTSSDTIGDVTNWFYEGGPYPDAATLQEGCESSGDTFVAP